jgi:hypothetical protein
MRLVSVAVFDKFELPTIMSDKLVNQIIKACVIVVMLVAAIFKIVALVVTRSRKQKVSGADHPVG